MYYMLTQWLGLGRYVSIHFATTGQYRTNANISIDNHYPVLIN